jgi:hypothetical protein
VLGIVLQPVHVSLQGLIPALAAPRPDRHTGTNNRLKITRELNRIVMTPFVERSSSRLSLRGAIVSSSHCKKARVNSHPVKKKKIYSSLDRLHVSFTAILCCHDASRTDVRLWHEVRTAVQATAAQALGLRQARYKALPILLERRTLFACAYACLSTVDPEVRVSRTLDREVGASMQLAACSNRCVQVRHAIYASGCDTSSLLSVAKRRKTCRGTYSKCGPAAGDLARYAGERSFSCAFECKSINRCRGYVVTLQL